MLTMLSCCGMYQNHPFLLPFWMTSVAPSSRPVSRYAFFPVGPDRALVEDRIPDAQPEPIHQQAVLSAGIHHDLRSHLAEALLVADLHADGAIAFEDHVVHANAFMDVDAVLAGVLEHHLVELAAHDLPRLRTLVRLVVPEVERSRLAPFGVDELHAVLLHEVAGLHLRQHVELLQHPVGLRDQRLADVKARKLLALEQLHGQALLGEQRRYRRPRRASADDDDFRIDVCRHASTTNRFAFISNRGNVPDSTTRTLTLRPSASRR